MNKALKIAASGMHAQQLTIDIIANNLANVNTTGYKKSSLEFQDMLYETIKKAGESTGGDSRRPGALQVGNGTRVVASQRSFKQGSITGSGNPLDIAIEGEGFLIIRMPDGTRSYTRDGSLKMTGDGALVTSDGFMLEPDITVPEDAREVFISTDGQVNVKLIGDDEPMPLGQMEIARFVNPGGLEAIGSNLYRETVASGAPLIGAPGEDGLGTLQQGFLETSNVDVVQEMVNMIEAQRSYELNSKTIKTTEEIYHTASQMKR
ncbi:MAG: flagellar basal-body rod protein FlgG [Calditrichia bacterium]